MSQENKNAFVGLRNMVFQLDPKEIGLTKEGFGHPVWGMVMETGFDEGSFSLIVMADGTTSLYFSSGGGIIGGGEHAKVRKASENFLTGAQHYYEQATIVTDFPTPTNGKVHFYFLCFDGHRLYSASEEQLGGGKDELASLFFAAHAVITDLRKIEKSS